MPPTGLLTDDALLCSDDPEAFGVFYDRHVKVLLGYFARRTFSPEEAADLTAETFASALVARKRFKPGKAPATAWLFAIAARRLCRAAHAALARDRAPAGRRGGCRDDPHAGRRRRAFRAVRVAARTARP